MSYKNPITAVIDNPDTMQQFRYRVEDETGCLEPFYVWMEDDRLFAGYEPNTTVDLRRIINATEWDAEYGGLCSYGQLLDAVRSAR